MSYGWARTELLGALINSVFLPSLCLYVFLEAIPGFIYPQPMEGGMWFIIVAGLGLIINTVGTIVFARMFDPAIDRSTNTDIAVVTVIDRNLQ
jgi:Co/Zn/Cd efflux system component